MLRKREEIKREHERAVADKLLKALEIDASFDKHGDPDKREPDLIYKIGGKTIGIEVTTAYYEQHDAKDSAEIATGEKSLRPDEIRPRSRGILGSPDQKICDSVQAAIHSKCGKTYSGVDETWLCIEQDAALTDAASTADCADNLKIPKESPLSKIFLLH